MSKKPFLNMDERSKQIAGKVIAIMYFLTIIALQIDVIVRQFVFDQNIHDFEDLAIILTINSLFLITALLYFGAISIQKLKIKFVLIFYAWIVVLGTIFTYLKYNVFTDANLSFSQLMNKLVIIFTISGLIVLFWMLFSILGKRKIDKELD